MINTLSDVSKEIKQNSKDLTSILDSCHQFLIEAPEAESCRNYLAERIKPSLWKRFGFGYFPPLDQLHLFTSTQQEILSKQNLLYERHEYDLNIPYTQKYNHFQVHPLIIPYYDEYHNLVSIVGRTLESEEKRKELGVQKYKNSFFTKSLHIFGLADAKKSILNYGYVIVVEGQFDQIACSIKGIHPVVGLGGSEMSKFQFYRLRKYTNRFYLLYDQDEAGQKGIKNTMNRYGKYAHFKKLEIPEGYKDIDIYLKHSKNLDLFELEGENAT